MANPTKEELHSLITSLVEPFDVEIVEITLGFHRATAQIKLLVDKPAGGISIDECSRINQNVVTAIEEQQLFNGDFILEVSSPGVDRPLTTKKDFLRNIGRKVQIFLTEPVEQKMEHQGDIKDVSDEGVVIQTEKKKNMNGMLLNIPLNKITKAIQII